MSIFVFPNAKINIGLQITTTRPDGYHDIQTCMYPIGWSDILEIIPSDKTTFEAIGIPIPSDGTNNLCLKAYQLLCKDFPLLPIDIILQKTIPIGAGLGGGSSDAAFMIKALNESFDLKLSNEQMESYAKKLGADCAFFIQNQAQFCWGKGDEFEKISINLKGKFILLIYPNLHISTAEAYSGVVAQASMQNLKDLISLPIKEWKIHIKNDFETSLFLKYPLLSSIKNTLYTEGALYASMSGSGATMYGIFENKIAIPEAFSDYQVYTSIL